MRAPPLHFRRRPPQSNCLPATVRGRVYLTFVRASHSTGWYFTSASARASARASTAPTYATQSSIMLNDKLQ